MPPKHALGHRSAMQFQTIPETPLHPSNLTLSKHNQSPRNAAEGNKLRADYSREILAPIDSALLAKANVRGQFLGDKLTSVCPHEKPVSQTKDILQLLENSAQSHELHQWSSLILIRTFVSI